MSFHFPLQAVLRFYQSVEHQQELRLHVANQEVDRALSALDHAEIEIREWRTRQTKELNSGIPAATLHFDLCCGAVLGRQKLELEAELARARAARNELQRIFQQIRQKRQTFESLRDAQLREYERDAARQEQRERDDLFLLGRAHRR